MHHVLLFSKQNVPPYGRSGLYLELANLKDLVDDYRSSNPAGQVDMDLLQTIYGLAQRSGTLNDVPFAAINVTEPDDAALPAKVGSEEASEWVSRLSEYLSVLQDRLFCEWSACIW